MVAQFLDDRLPPRFWDKVIPEPNSGCWLWLWLSSVSPDGYGQFKFDGGMRGAHRVAYGVLVAEVSVDLVMDHLCRTPCCVNPAHMEPVTDAENARRGRGGHLERARTHCRAGHPYDDLNTARRNGRRHCRECERAKCRRYHDKNRAAENERSRRYYAKRRGAA